nr:zinc-binding dehydrogenase [Streptomyces sp. 5-6(2022)]
MGSGEQAHGVAGVRNPPARQPGAGRGDVLGDVCGQQHGAVLGQEVIDDTAVVFTEVVRDIDVVLDTIGGETVERWLEVLRPGGHLVTAVAEEDSELIATYEVAGMCFSGIAVDPDPVALRGLGELVEQGRVRAHVQGTFPFECLADAHRLLDSGHFQGKLVLTI